MDQNLLPWSWFSHFTIDHDAGILRLYSAFCTGPAFLDLKAAQIGYHD